MSASINIPSASSTPKSYASSFSSSLSSSPTSPSPSRVEKRGAERSRRPSLLSNAILQQQPAHYEIDGRDRPYVISYVSCSQGFSWNPEIFLSSYMDRHSIPLSHHREPVHEVVISEEEARMMYPQ